MWHLIASQYLLSKVSNIKKWLKYLISIVKCFFFKVETCNEDIPSGMANWYPFFFVNLPANSKHCIVDKNMCKLHKISAAVIYRKKEEYSVFFVTFIYVLLYVLLST